VQPTSVTLLDHVRIAAVVAALAHAQDGKDWPRFRELFADRVTLDRSAHSGRSAETLTAEALTGTARTILQGFACTLHTASDLLIDVTGAAATGRAHVVAYHHLPADGIDFCTMRGQWRLGLVKTDDRWTIREWAIVRTAPWEGNPDLYRLASQGAHGVLRDPS
jgi:hypothetical protein